MFGAVLPKEGALTGDAPADTLHFFFFGLALVGLGNTPTAGELNALPSPVPCVARAVSTVRLRRFRNSSEAGLVAADAADDDDERKLNGCGRFLLEEGGGVKRLSDILRIVFLCGETPRPSPFCACGALPVVPWKDRCLDNVGADRTLESEPVRAIR